MYICVICSVVYIWGMGVDDVRGVVYWDASGKIKQTTLNGSSTKTVIKAGKWNVT